MCTLCPYCSTWKLSFEKSIMPRWLKNKIAHTQALRFASCIIGTLCHFVFWHLCHGICWMTAATSFAPASSLINFWSQFHNRSMHTSKMAICGRNDFMNYFHGKISSICVIDPLLNCFFKQAITEANKVLWNIFYKNSNLLLALSMYINRYIKAFSKALLKILTLTLAAILL